MTAGYAGAARPDTKESAMNLTPEQLKILEAVRTTKGTVKVQAGAGTGKTTTLVAIANELSEPTVVVAFNKAIVEDVSPKLPSHARAATTHSIAFRAVGKDFVHRLNAPRKSNAELAKLLRLEDMLEGRKYIVVGDTVIQPGTVARLVMRAMAAFCQSGDEEPAARHLPYVEGIDEADGYGERTYTNNRALGAMLLPIMRGAWHDLRNPQGQLPFSHDVYFKIWSLNPSLNAAVVLLDEAQDSSGALIDALRRLVKQGKRLILVGDAQQAIFEWRGAVNAMAAFEGRELFLTNSFRFGPAIAAEANRVLGSLPTQLRITGAGPKDSQVGPIADPKAILCRTNARAVEIALEAQGRGKKVSVVGGGREVAAFARGAQELIAKGWTGHADLTIFRTWGEVVSYVESGDGDDLGAMVRLVERFGTEAILACLDASVGDAHADLIVTTAHKSKGLGFDTVQLADDFCSDLAILGQEERRLLYVAITRAKLALDLTRVPAERQTRARV